MYKENEIAIINEEYLALTRRKIYRLVSLFDGGKKPYYKLFFNVIRNNRAKRFSHLIKKNNFYHEEVNESKKVIVYTAIFGKYDKVWAPFYKDPRCEYCMITDNNESSAEGWKVIKIPKSLVKELSGLSNAEKNRYFKMHGEKIFCDYEYLIYVDGNVCLYGNVYDMIANISPVTGLAMFNHPLRDCIYDEGKACIILKKTKSDMMNAQLSRYRSEKFPRDFGMCECCIIVRRNNTYTNHIMDEWWEEFIKSESKRDQISFPYVLWKNGLSINDIGTLGKNARISGMFRFMEHSFDKTRKEGSRL